MDAARLKTRFRTAMTGNSRTDHRRPHRYRRGRSRGRRTRCVRSQHRRLVVDDAGGRCGCGARPRPMDRAALGRFAGVIAWAGALLIIAQDGSISRIAQVTGSLAGYGPHTECSSSSRRSRSAARSPRSAPGWGSRCGRLVRSVHSTPAVAGASRDRQPADHPVAPRVSRPKRPIIARSVAKEVPHA